MSKIGKKIITIPDGVEVKLNGQTIEVKGKNGTVMVPLLPFISMNIADKEITFSLTTENLQARANWGTVGSLMANAIEGVTAGFTKVLEIEGVGFRVAMEGRGLTLNVGFSHPVKFLPPEGTALSVEKNTITIKGIDKAVVGEVAAQIRRIKKPEPYKGKGIRYQGEVIRRKAGKKVAG